MSEEELLKRITIKPEICHGKTDGSRFALSS